MKTSIKFSNGTRISPAIGSKLTRSTVGISRDNTPVAAIESDYRVPVPVLRNLTLEPWFATRQSKEVLVEPGRAVALEVGVVVRFSDGVTGEVQPDFEVPADYTYETPVSEEMIDWQHDADYSHVDRFMAMHNNIESLNQLCETVQKKFLTEADITRAAFTWVANNISYDYSMLLPGNYKEKEAQETFTDRKGICGDFSRLMMHVCQQCGIPSRFIVGPSSTTNEYISNLNEHRHAWVAAKADDRWMLCDPTYAGTGSTSRAHMRPNFYASWFDVAPQLLIHTHLAENPSMQLLNNPWNAEKWNRRRDVRSLHYLADIGIPQRELLKTLASGAPTVAVYGKPQSMHLKLELPIDPILPSGTDFLVNVKRCSGGTLTIVHNDRVINPNRKHRLSRGNVGIYTTSVEEPDVMYTLCEYLVR
jgi:transglutaminase-like putative cysteine protease